MSTAHAQVWLITGANSGFGRAIAEAAVAAGDTVVAAVRRPDAMTDLVETAPDRVTALQLDVTDSARIAGAVAEVLDRHGRVDGISDVLDRAKAELAAWERVGRATEFD